MKKGAIFAHVQVSPNPLVCMIVDRTDSLADWTDQGFRFGMYPDVGLSDLVLTVNLANEPGWGEVKDRREVGVAEHAQ